MEERKNIKERLWEEAKTMLALFAYLAVFLGAFTTYKRLLLAEFGVPFFEYGCALVEALLLSKVIVLGRALRVGDRFAQSRLFVPALYKTFCFCLLVLCVAIGEHFVVGRWHGESGRALVDSLAKTGVWEIPARMLTWFIAFIPLFAFFEADRALGEGTLVKLFFAGSSARAAAEPVIPIPAPHKKKVIPTARV